jgi:hypothetical protein
MIAWLKQQTNSISLYEKISLVISLLGALSLIFIYVQTRLISQQSAQTTKNMQASMYATIATQTLEMDRLFIEKPELRPYFYRRVEIAENDKNYDLVMAIAEYQLDYFDATRTQLGYIPDDADKAEDRETWNRYFADSFSKSPILCKRINMNRNWYMHELLDIADANCNNARS